MLEEKKKPALIGIAGGSVLQIVAYAVLMLSTSIMLLLAAALLGLIGFVMLMYGSASFATGKGYAGWLGALLVFLLSWVGLIILAVLPDRMKRGTMTDVPMMAPAYGYNPSYGAADYDQGIYSSPTTGYGLPGASYGSVGAAYEAPGDPFAAQGAQGSQPTYPSPALQTQAPAYGAPDAYAHADPFATYADQPARPGGNGNGAAAGNGNGAGNGFGAADGNGGSSSFDQPAPDFQWEPASRPTPAPAYAAGSAPGQHPDPTTAYVPPPYPAAVPGADYPAVPQADQAYGQAASYGAGYPEESPGSDSSAMVPNWPPAGHWSTPQR